METNQVLTKRPSGSRRVQMHLPSESSVEQTHARETDINKMVARYQKTGVLPQVIMAPSYGDFAGVGDYHDAQNRLIDANSNFMKLPADLRSLFDNDAGKLVDFVLDVDNREEAIELGLVEPDETSLPEAPPPEAAPEGLSSPPTSPIAVPPVAPEGGA